jgi:hypothetical protein
METVNNGDRVGDQPGYERHVERRRGTDSSPQISNIAAEMTEIPGAFIVEIAWSRDQHLPLGSADRWRINHDRAIEVATAMLINPGFGIPGFGR